MDILNIATESGLLVTLDGRIGCQEYRSVHGSIQALQRFADALLASSVVDDARPRSRLDFSPNEP
ncbi:hypothetical protein EYW47_28920 [Paraburkholderia silviterrae]|uniref:Uncharacterized protein n=1 Tax=Paraburkholderia silviterrae TaxID=2528715 RepID=A0A4R5M3M5_9BURK|nr:hypothetical protein EYW47_28920 [Paraburkholderia silviterrae]